jgi:hypothetical protein
MTPMPVDDRPCMSGIVCGSRARTGSFTLGFAGSGSKGPPQFQDWKMSDRHCASMMQRNQVVLGNEVATRRPTYVCTLYLCTTGLKRNRLIDALASSVWHRKEIRPPTRTSISSAAQQCPCLCVFDNPSIESQLARFCLVIGQPPTPQSEQRYLLHFVPPPPSHFAFSCLPLNVSTAGQPLNKTVASRVSLVCGFTYLAPSRARWKPRRPRPRHLPTSDSPRPRTPIYLLSTAPTEQSRTCGSCGLKPAAARSH